jgi:hypothetical protein
MSDSNKRLDRQEQRLFLSSLGEDVERIQWRDGEAAIELGPSDENEIFIDSDELFHVNGRWNY